MSYQPIFLTAVAAALAAPVPEAQPLSRPAGASVAMEVGSWGHEGFSWTIDAGGDGQLREAGLPDEKGSYDVSIWRFHGGKAAAAGVQALMQPILDRYGHSQMKCDLTLPDGPQGSLTWTLPGGSGRLSLFYGCRSEEAKSAFELVARVDAAVTRLAKAHKASEVRRITAESRPGG